MTIKRLFTGFAILSFAMGLFFLFNGESVVSLLFVFLVLLLLQVGAIADLSRRIKQIEDYLSQCSQLGGADVHSKEDGGE